MGLFATVKNFFCDEETPPKKIYDPDSVTLVNAADLFPVHVMSDTETMNGIIRRQELQDEIEKKVTSDFLEEVKKQKAALNQPKTEPAAPTQEAKPDWLAGVDDKL